MATREVAGKIGMQIVPGSIGAMLSRSQLGEPAARAPRTAVEDHPSYSGRAVPDVRRGAVPVAQRRADRRGPAHRPHDGRRGRRSRCSWFRSCVMHVFVYFVEFRGRVPVEPGATPARAVLPVHRRRLRHRARGEPLPPLGVRAGRRPGSGRIAQRRDRPLLPRRDRRRGRAAASLMATQARTAETAGQPATAKKAERRTAPVRAGSARTSTAARRPGNGPRPRSAASSSPQSSASSSTRASPARTEPRPADRRHRRPDRGARQRRVPRAHPRRESRPRHGRRRQRVRRRSSTPDGAVVEESAVTFDFVAQQSTRGRRPLLHRRSRDPAPRAPGRGLHRPVSRAAANRGRAFSASPRRRPSCSSAR